MATDALPIYRRSRVYHVGTLDPDHKGRQGRSFEGDGLSVSLHPQEWSRIARLGGPTWQLTRQGGAFLDYHRFVRRGRLPEVQRWAIRQGLLALRPRWKVEWYDSDEDGAVHSLYPTAASAARELRHLREGDDTANCVRLEVAVATRTLNARLGFKVDDLLALEMATTCWVEACTALDGVWWTDTLDPVALSAPRGVIGLTRLALWTKTRVG